MSTGGHHHIDHSERFLSVVVVVADLAVWTLLIPGRALVDLLPA